MDTDTLSRREAALRSAATGCLAGIALVQAIGLPSLFAQGREFGVLSMAAMALCIGLGWALAAAPAGAGRELWSAVAAAAVLVLAGWAAPRVVAFPGLENSSHATITTKYLHHWTATAGGACAVLAAVCVVLAAAAARPSRAAVRGFATAAGVLVAMVPCVAVLIVAVGPGTAGGEATLAAVGHVHSHASFDNAIQFRPGSGQDGNGSHFVVAVTQTPHQTVIGLTLMIATALLFVYGAVGYLRRRSAPAAPVAIRGIDGRLA
jgi:hypothetical protein